MVEEVDDELVTEELSTIIKLGIEQVLGQEMLPYQTEKANSWCQQIMDFSLKELIKQSKPYKYVVTCILQQKNWAGMQTAATTFWNSNTDGLSSITLDGSYFTVVVTIFAMRIWHSTLIDTLRKLNGLRNSGL